MNNETNLQTDDGGGPEGKPTKHNEKAAQQRAAIVSAISADGLPGVYVLSNIDKPQIGGADYDPTDLLPGYDYIIIPVARKVGRTPGLGWVKF